MYVHFCLASSEQPKLSVHVSVPAARASPPDSRVGTSVFLHYPNRTAAKRSSVADSVGEETLIRGDGLDPSQGPRPLRGLFADVANACQPEHE